MRNPDFMRYWWVEAAPMRLATALILVLGVSLAMYLSGPNVFAGAATSSGMAIPFPLMAIYACTGMFGLWGTRAVVASVLDEIQDGVWDTHRLSGLSPWQMVTGRVFGACGLMWVCCGTLAVLFVVHGLLETEASLGALLLRAAVMLLIGIACVSASLAQSLMLTRLAGRRMGHVLAQLAGLVVLVGAGIKLDLINFLLNSEVPRISLPIEHTGQYWYGHFVDKDFWYLLVCFAAAAGFLCAAWRAMYLARVLPAPPLGIPVGGMLLGMMVAWYGAGLEPWRGGVGYRQISWLLWAMSMALMYGVFFSNNNLLSWRHWRQRRSWAQKFALVPGWVLPFVMLVIGTIWLMWWQQTDVAKAMRPAQMYGTAPAWAMMIVGVGYTIRDILLVVCLASRRDGKPVFGRIIFMFPLCYGLAMMFDAIGLLHVAVVLAWPWQPAFNPDIAAGISRIHISVLWVGCAALTTQLMVMLGWLWLVVRRARAV